MRADAMRNLDALLETGARMVAADPGVSIVAIAAEAGVDRRTVYRRFATREALLDAISEAKVVVLEEVVTAARLTEAPVPVALHRLVEGAIAACRRFPLDQDQMRNPSADRPVRAQQDRIEGFVQRAVEEGVLRSGLPAGLARTLILDVVMLLALQFPELEPGYAADIAVEILLGGIGRRASTTAR